MRDTEEIRVERALVLEDYNGRNVVNQPTTLAGLYIYIYILIVTSPNSVCMF